VTVSVFESLLPPEAAVIVELVLITTFLPVTVAVATLFGPDEVVLLDGAIVAALVAVHVTTRPCSGWLLPSSTTAVAVVVWFFLIVVF